jgi:uncharacterized phage protein gp47/JayE
MALTQQQWSTLMVQQLQLLDPSVSAFVGTPERKIIDTVASALANASIDLSALSNALNYSGKVGSDLDAFVGLFGFARQGGTYAVGTVTFSIEAPVAFAIAVPYNTQLLAQNSGTPVVFDTAAGALIDVGDPSVDVPVRCEVAGALGEVAAGAINAFVGNGQIIGITGITNALATSGGNDIETDAALKARFQNQVFRNVSGTTDQYLATALQTANVAKANCIGPISRYQEYLQVPAVDDSQYESVSDGTGTQVSLPGGPSGNPGRPGTWTTGLSTIPYSKYIWTELATFVSDSVVQQIFYQPGIDYVFNTLAAIKNHGDAYRLYTAESENQIASPTGVGVTPVAGGGVDDFVAGGTFFWMVTAYTAAGETNSPEEVTSTVAANGSAILTWNPVFDAIGYRVYRATVTGDETISPSLVGIIFDPDTLTFTDVGYPPVAGAVPATNTATINTDQPNPLDSPFQPNISFLNVYTGNDGTVQAARPGDVVLFEHSYTSSESRNDYTRNITNCVDVFVDGENPTTASATLGVPHIGATLFNSNPLSPLYIENYRRVGEPEHRPVIGNLFMPVFWAPLISLPETITAGGYTYYLGIHYYAVQEVDSIGGTVRARDGIEWNLTAAAGSPPVGSAPSITLNPGPTVQVDGYVYDKNIVDLQTALEGVKQSTTDVLGHQSVTQYYKLDVTVMYTPGSSVSVVNGAIQAALQTYLTGQYFGATIQMSTLLNIIHNVQGISNVRWSRDVDDTLDEITVCDINGNPLRTMQLDRVVLGTSSTPEIQQGYFVGSPVGGTFTLSLGDLTTLPIGYSTDTAFMAFELDLYLAIAGIGATYTSGTGTPEDPFIFTFSSDGFQTDVLTCTPSLIGGPYSINNDFFLLDSQLPSLPTGQLATDTLPGLIIRPRAQDTWLR